MQAIEVVCQAQMSRPEDLCLEKGTVDAPQ